MYDKRKEALNQLVAAMSVLYQTGDIGMVGTIIHEASDKFGAGYIDKLTWELSDPKAEGEDIKAAKAILAAMLPLPKDAMSIIN